MNSSFVSFPVFCGLFLSLASGLSAQDAAPVDMGHMMKELTEIQEQQKVFLAKSRQQLIQNCNEAARSPEKALDAYQQAVMAMNFAGASRENSKFKEWKEKEKGKWSKEFEAGLQFYFYYLAISLRKGGGESNETLYPQVLGYCRDFMAAPKDVRDQEWVKKPINSTIIANWLQISSLLPKGDSWEMIPANIDSICEKTLLPWWREQKNPAVLDYWDQKLLLEASDAEDTKLDSAAGKFGTLRRPTLLWNKAQEYFALGQTNRGLTESFAIIKSNPTHPQFNAWVASLKERLAAQQAAPANPGTN